MELYTKVGERNLIVVHTKSQSEIGLKCDGSKFTLSSRK